MFLPCLRLSKLVRHNLWLAESHLSCRFWNFALKFWKVVGNCEWYLPFYECRLSGRNTQRWWGHSNPTCCNNFCHSEVVKMQKHVPCVPLHLCTYSCLNESPGETFTI